MSIKLGTTDINKIYLGDTEINKAYLGDVLVYDKTSAFDTDYQAVLDAATLAGDTLPTYDQQILQNQLMIDLKTAGIFSKADRLGIFVNDAGKDFAFRDWKDPSKKYVDPVSGAMVWELNKFVKKPASVIEYLNIQYNPTNDAVNYGLNDVGIMVRWDGYSGNFGTDQGMIRGALGGITQTSEATWLYDGNFNCRIYINKDGSASAFGNAYRFVTSFADGNICVGLTGNVAYLYKNESLLTSVAQTPSAITNRNIIIHDGVTAEREYQYLYLGAYLNTTEQSALENAFQNYYNSL